MSEFGGGAENICSHGVFRILTHNGCRLITGGGQDVPIQQIQLRRNHVFGLSGSVEDDDHVKRGDDDGSLIAPVCTDSVGAWTRRVPDPMAPESSTMIAFASASTTPCSMTALSSCDRRAQHWSRRPHQE